MEINTDKQKIEEVLERGAQEVIEKKSLAEKMASGKRLRIKFGIDPTAADIHLGHAAVFRKLRQFQDLGHLAVLIIGDFTTLIGDPSGRTASRPQLTSEQIRNNMKDYINQAAKLIDIDKAEIHYNSEWFGTKPMSFLMDLAGRFTVARLIEREDFQKRLKEGFDVSMLELLYPLLQGYDSVAVKADVELGGYDQRLNLLFGRKVLRAFDMSEQEVVMAPLLIGVDGQKKMSKSVGNYIGINEEPAKMFGKIMAIPDDLMWNYFELLTDVAQKEIFQLKEGVKKEQIHPRDAKMKLAYKITTDLCGKENADFAQKEFVSVYQKNEKPAEIKCKKIKEGGYTIPELMTASGACPSNSEARRLVKSGSVELNFESIGGNIDWNEKHTIKRGEKIEFKIGKNKYFGVQGE